MRVVYLAVPIAIAICAAAPVFADVQSQVQAAKKAERRGEWKKALEGWKAAYAADVNAEYLIGIGDCYAKLGNNDEARKNYDAYLADPLALPANVDRIKAKIASLDRAGGALALPGGGIALPGSDSPPPLPSAAPPPPGLDLPGSASAVAEEKGGRKTRHKKGIDAAPLPLPGLDLPDATPARVAENKPAGGTGLALELPGLPLPAATQPAAKPEKKEPPAVASNAPTRTSTGKTLAMNTAPTSTTQKTEPRRVPEAAVAETPGRRSQAEASGTGRTVAFVAAGVAVVALGGGALAFTKASSAHSELTSKVHDGATAQSLLETESKNKTLSFVGFAGGLVAAGIATALFAF